MKFGFTPSEEDLIDQWDRVAKPDTEIDKQFNAKADDAQKSLASEDIFGPLSVWFKFGMSNNQPLSFCDHLDTGFRQNIGIEDETATQYYLSNVIDLPKVSEVYACEESGDWTKFITVLNENDYDVKEKLYDIEGRILEFYPDENLYFRVTVCQKDAKPVEVPTHAVKLYPNE